MRHHNNTRPRGFLLTILLVALGFGPAAAQVVLRWSPADTTLAPGATARLGLYLDQPLNIRAVEIQASYDSSVVASLGGGPGRLFTDSGHFCFQDFENHPNRWHGLAIVIGAGLCLQGPGEIFYWEVEGLAEGTSPIETVDVVLYDDQAQPTPVPDVSLDSAHILVQDPLSATRDVPAAAGRLALYPNPFNPGVRVSFHLDRETDARLTVHDTRGRQVAVLNTGRLPAGEQVFHWNGQNTAGHVLPAGIYVFRLEAGPLSRQAKAALIK